MNVVVKFFRLRFFFLLFVHAQCLYILSKTDGHARHSFYGSSQQASIDQKVERNSDAKAMGVLNSVGKANQNDLSTRKRKFHSINSPDTKFRRLNQKIVSSKTAMDIVILLSSNPDALMKTSGGGVLNSVNFATSIHRIARDVGNRSLERSTVLSDPKFALFLCSFAEALLGIEPSQPLSSLRDFNATEVDNNCKFSIRERTNLIWALAKLRVVPPSDKLSIGDRDAIRKRLFETSVKLRAEILASPKTGNKAWMSSLSLLAGCLMDFVATTILDLDKVTMQEISNMLWAFATAQRSDIKVFDQLASKFACMLKTNPKAPKPQELSITIWAFATSKHVAKSQYKLLQHFAEFLDDEKWRKSFKTQELANTAWGISTLINQRRESGEANNESLEQKEEDLIVTKILRHLSQEIIERCDEYKTQEISITIWAFGTLGFGIGRDAAKSVNINDYILLYSNDYHGDEILVNKVLFAIRASIMKRLPQFKEQELNNLAHGCARMNKQQPELFLGIAKEFSKRESKITGQDIGTTLWSFAATDFSDPGAFVQVLSRLRVEAVQFWNPQEISNMVWAIGTAGIKPRYSKAFDSTLVPRHDRQSWEVLSRDPVSLAFAAAAKEIIRRPHEFKSQEIKDSLWGFSKAGIRYPLLFKTVAEYLVGSALQEVPVSKLHVGAGLEHFSSQEIANLCWAYAKQGTLASANSDTFRGRMGIYCSGAADFGESLLKRLINCAVEADLANYGDLSKLSSNDISNTIWALATLGFRFDNFLKKVEKQVLKRCKNDISSQNQFPGNVFNGQEIANIIWSFATLDAITAELLDTVESLIVFACGDGSTESIARFLNRQELANLVWSCTVAGHYPPKMIQILQRGLIGETADEQTSRYMDETHGNDGGLTEHGVLTLIYLHYSMELDDIRMKIELPQDFPNGWGMFQNCDVLDDESGISLTVTKSKMQDNVASAFSRLGLDVVDEYIVPFPGDLPDILSLDIADVVKKIGIEVDGPSHFYCNMDQWSPQGSHSKEHLRVSNNGRIDSYLDWDSENYKSNGSTSLKARLLRKLGWKIIRIPFWDWRTLNGDEKAQEEYCRRALEGIG